MNFNSNTIAKLSLDPRNPRNKELFDCLVGFVESSGGPAFLPAKDENIVRDFESELGFLPMKSRLRWLRLAKQQVLQVYLTDCLDQREVQASPEGAADGLIGRTESSSADGRRPATRNRAT